MEKRKEILSITYKYLAVIFAAVLLAVNYHFFIVRNNFAPAGINGIATMIQYKTGFSIGYMSLIINVPLCIFSYFCINKKYAKRSLVFHLTYSFVYLGLQKLGLENLQYNANGHDTIYPVIISGVLSGLVYSIGIKVNSATGGSEMVSKYISIKKPEFNFFKVVFILNAIVAMTSFFVYADTSTGAGIRYDYKPVCLCILYCFISTFLGDYIIKGTKTACQFTIITTHPDEISKEIAETIKHSTTKVSAMGSYTNDNRYILFCIVLIHLTLSIYSTIF